MPLADARAALTDALEPETPYKMSLNGTWKLSWAGSPALRVRGFEAPGYDDSAWFDVVVPGCVELQGFGSPGYTNIRYPHAMKPPKILDRTTLKDDYNPVSSYRTHFTVPAAWKGREVILRFDGVYSAYYVWVNGKKVGYAEDSKLPSEFDITPHLAAGDNVLAVEVYRWCDGSYLEDQDMFRYSGIFRDVTLWARPKDGIWDFAVKTKVSDDCTCAELAVEGCDLAMGELFDPDGKSVGTLTAGLKPLLVPNVRLWSAEKPSLYTLVLKKGGDIRMKRIGFKDQKVAGNLFLVNGQPVKLKGVNRHECSPDNGLNGDRPSRCAEIIFAIFAIMSPVPADGPSGRNERTTIMARTRRVKKEGDAHYHVMSRTNGRRFLFEKGDCKGEMVRLLKVAAAFSGVS